MYWVNIKKLLHISRPKFWLYLAGPVLLALATGGTPNFFQFSSILLLFLFLFPANLYLYGINDYFDFDTDKYNIAKKGTHEYKLLQTEKKWLKIIILLALFMLLAATFLFTRTESKIIYLFFLFLATFYSTPPLRFKSKPVLDSLSNILYILPAFAIYFSHNYVSLPSLFSQNTLTFFALLLWPVAMHLYSAIPDIFSDKKAHLPTTAVVFGWDTSVLLCALLWSIFFFVLSAHSPLLLVTLIYPLIPTYLFFQKDHALLDRLYWFFPWINGILGFYAFILLFLKLI